MMRKPINRRRWTRNTLHAAASAASAAAAAGAAAAAAAVTVPSPAGLDHFVNAQGGFTHSGWLSVSEMTLAMDKLKLKGSVTHVYAPARIRHLQNGQCMFILMHGHWVCLMLKCEKLLFFDPAGQPMHVYLQGHLPHVHDLRMCVQFNQSVLCGNFCLFACFVVMHVMPNVNKHSVPTAAASTLSQFLYQHPSPLGPNCMVMTLFTNDFRLGEEFDDDPRYPKIAAYRTHIANHSLCTNRHDG
ncbi:LO8 [Micropterus dolomieu adomavirus 2]|uniref:LO8 n=1 Tax=Micropterus dolomieu adomavirus 2 TaxID=2681676 RepID=A0A650BTU5_9VIRU|nr:LO8 [Micropterus dolomieu adomavirus 2]